MEPISSLYVGDLDSSVSDVQLLQTFSAFEGFLSAIVCKDRITGGSLCYGYANFVSPQQAARALETTNRKLINGKAIRVMWSQRNSEVRKSGVGNVFVKNLDSSVDHVKLEEIFSKYGNIVSCKVATSQEGKSKGYGYVQFASADSAAAAIEKANGYILEGKEIYVGQFMKKSERDHANPEASYSNLYFKNLDQEVTEDLLLEKFSPFGKITSLVITKYSNGVPRGFGFVNFENSGDAKRAKESLNGTQLGSQVLYVARAQKKDERKQILHQEFEQRRMERKGSNLYIKNISDNVDDDQLKTHFEQCGKVTSAKIVRNDKGLCKGFGFVCFSSHEEANKAIATLSGVIFHGKPLYVAIAQTKEERRALLQACFAKRNARFLGGPFTAIIPPICPPVYHPGLEFMPPPFWRPPTLPMQPLAGRDFLPQRPPMVPPVRNPGRMHANPPGDAFAAPSPRIQNHTRLAYQQPQATSNELISPSATAEDLSSMLAAASPEKRKTMLGNRLHPLVEKLKPDLASKITGMLLEMDNAELLLLLDSPESLATKVDEAVQVLELHQRNE